MYRGFTESSAIVDISNDPLDLDKVSMCVCVRTLMVLVVVPSSLLYRMLPNSEVENYGRGYVISSLIVVCCLCSFSIIIKKNRLKSGSRSMINIGSRSEWETRSYLDSMNSEILNPKLIIDLGPDFFLS